MAWTAVEDRLSAIAPVAAWVEAAAVAADLPEAQRYELQVCLEEILANLILHACPRAGDKAIRVGVVGEPGRFTLRVADSCLPFDPRRAPDPTEPPAVGGRGLRLIAAFAPNLAYDAGPHGNALTITFSAEGA